MASVTVSGDEAIASVGAGASWLDVYLYLDGLGVAVAGGRNGAVGVGGLTLGGHSFHLSKTLQPILTCLVFRWHFLFCTTRRMGMRQCREFRSRFPTCKP